jgi:hypothetical protein
MSLWLYSGLLGVLVLLAALLGRAQLQLAQAERHLASLTEATTRERRLRDRLRRERRRVRRSHRLKRSAQRVVGMVRAVVGCRTAGELARCATQALVDGFGVRRAVLWTIAEPVELLAEASAPGYSPPSPIIGERFDVGALARRSRVITLQDADRRPLARLVFELDDAARVPPGLAGYTAVLGAMLGVRGIRAVDEDGRDRPAHEYVSPAAVGPEAVCPEEIAPAIERAA